MPGQSLFELLDALAVGGALAAEGFGKGMNHCAVASCGCLRRRLVLGLLLTAQGFDAFAQFGLDIEAVQADARCAGDDPEVALLVLLYTYEPLTAEDMKPAVDAFRALRRRTWA
ncbi:hypothetical protein GCM10010331_15860 [Streptomyces xanthochromogenes]|uniref:hypothetical protein n=1 Tax=Streptomyces xanthochromogenes TaxID=67384 RepID=UPI001675E3DA|nr:hypothetical protein [Streptomyces xanthochromogenes]GHB30304.1 hypothetical protein GCM10010331_15860 [Streptomyces xanthochromogenes]